MPLHPVAQTGLVLLAVLSSAAAAGAESNFAFRTFLPGLSAPAQIPVEEPIEEPALEPTPEPAGCSADMVLGETCELDGVAVFYGGSLAGARVFFAMTDEPGGYAWGTYGLMTGYDSTTDGHGNTHGLVARYRNNVDEFGTRGVPAAQVCADKGSDWYLPALDQLHLLWVNRGAIGLAAKGIQIGDGLWYQTSSEFTDRTYPHVHRFSDGYATSTSKHRAWRVRCARRE